MTPRTAPPAARERADLAARSILRPAFEQLLALEARVARSDDSSALHALRVALRRMRSVLRELEGLLPEPERAELADALRGLGQITGPVRDLDVLLVAFDQYRDAVPEPHREHLEPLRRSLEATRRRALRELRAGMTAPRRHAILTAFERFDAAELDAAAAPPLGAVARARVGRVAKRVKKRGRAIGPKSEPSELHELRKEVKRLRYLLELFRSAFPARDRRALLADLKSLQDVLGAYQDRDAHYRILERAALGPLGRAGPKTYVAAGMLLERVAVERAAAREAFPEAFRGFDCAKAKEHLRAVTRSS